MAEVLFYHLENSPIAAVLPGLLEKTLERGWRAVVKAGTQDAVAALDGLLWTYRDDSFLPHGAGAPDPRQPVWLTASDDIAADRDVLFLVEGGSVPESSMAAFRRTVLLFNEEGAPEARETWKSVKAAGLDATYWRQSAGGRWEKAG